MERLIIRPAPLGADGHFESLASWMFRLARANGHASYGELLQSEGFGLAPCALVDVDPDRWGVLELLCRLTGISNLRLRALSLDGALAAMTGSTGSVAGRWLLSSAGKGCRYAVCPACLTQAPEAYWHCSWRLTIHTLCPEHRTPLVDSCDHCGRPMIISASRTISLRRCEGCERPFVMTASSMSSNRIGRWRVLPPDQAMTSRLPVEVVHPKLWWDGVRVLLNVLGRPQLAARLQKAGLPRSLSPILASMAAGPRMKFDHQSGATRHAMLDLVAWLTAQWPERFVRSMNDARIGCGEYATAETQVPYWLWSVCRQHLDRKRYRTSTAEVHAAAALLSRSTKPASKISLKRALGVTEAKALDALRPAMIRRLSNEEILSLVELLKADLASAPAGREQHASLLRDACSIAVSAWLGISLRSASQLDLERGRGLVDEWRVAAGVRDVRGRLAASFVDWMQPYLEGTRVRFERYDQPQHALFLSRYGVATHGFGLAARLADLLRRCAIPEWNLGSRLLTAVPKRAGVQQLSRAGAIVDAAAPD